MSDQLRPPGETTVSPEVLIDIVRLATLSVSGVHAIAPVPGGVNRIFTKGGNEGVQLSIAANTVSATVYVILENSYEVSPVAHAIIQKVGRAISEMVGMEIGNVDVHIEDIVVQSGKEFKQ